MSDRVLVMREGRQMGIFAGADLDQERDHDRGGGDARDRRPEVMAPAPPPTAAAVLQAERVKSLSLRRRARPHRARLQPRRRRLPERALRQPAADRHLDHLARGCGRDARHHHPQHRPVGRVDGRRGGLPDGRAARRQHRHCRRRWPSPSPSASVPLLGLVNGLLVAVAKVPSIIATLGTLSIYRSLLTNHAGGKTIATGELPEWIVDLPRSTRVHASATTRSARCSSSPSSSPSCSTWSCSTLRAGRHLYALGSEPRGRPPGGPRRAATADRRVRRLRGAGRSGRVPLRRRASAPSTSPPARVSSWRPSPPRSSAG